MFKKKMFPTPTEPEILLAWCMEIIEQLSPVANHPVFSGTKNTQKKYLSSSKKQESVRAAKPDSAAKVTIEAYKLQRAREAMEKYKLLESVPGIANECWKKAVKAGASTNITKSFQLDRDATITIRELIEHIGKLATWCRQISLSDQYFLHIQEVNMGDKYIAGQVIGQGKIQSLNAHDISFSQILNQKQGEIDLQCLAIELQKLRSVLKQHSDSEQPVHDLEIGAVAEAELYASKSNGPLTFKALAKAGQWSLGIAEKIGVGVAAAAISQHLAFNKIRLEGAY